MHSILLSGQRGGQEPTPNKDGPNSSQNRFLWKCLSALLAQRDAQLHRTLGHPSAN